MIIKREKKKTLFLFLCGALIGAVAFFVVFSSSALDPTNLSYVRGGYVERDIIQHYAGWQFYRMSPLTFPIGIAEGMNAPEGASVVYSDSIPLFAILFKLLSPVLPAHFQYFGIFVLLSFILQGGSAAILLSLFVQNDWIALTGTLPFIFCPIMIERAFRHTALSAHYLILLAFYCYFSHHQSEERHYALWIVLCVCAPLIHIYFLPMIYAILLAEVIDCGKGEKRVTSIIHLLGCLVLSVLVLYIAGAFSTGSSGTSFGYGYFSMNVNSIFNPLSVSGIHWSILLPTLPQGYGTYDGFNYWGIGILISFALIGLYLLVSFKKTRPLFYVKAHPGLFTVCIALTLFAVSTTVIANNSAFVRIPLPWKFYELCSIFRSSGRMFWPVTYLVYLFVIVFLSHRFTRRKLGNYLILLLVVIQLADLTPTIIQKHKSMAAYTDQFEILTDSPFFEVNRETYSNVNCPGNGAFRGLYVALWCAENNMSTNFPFLARYDVYQHAEKAEKTREDLLRGIYDENTLYLFSSEDETLFHNVAYYVDGEELMCGKAGKEFYFIAPVNDKFSLPESDDDLILYNDLPLCVADYSDDIWDHGVLLSKPNTITFLNNAFSWSFLDGATAIFCNDVEYTIERIYDDPGYIMVEVCIEDGHALTNSALTTDIRG